jgi:hypothetical protein
MPEESADKTRVEQAPATTDKNSSTAPPVAQPSPAAQMSKEDEQIVLERLRDLGYVD